MLVARSLTSCAILSSFPFVVNSDGVELISFGAESFDTDLQLSEWILKKVRSVGKILGLSFQGFEHRAICCSKRLKK